MKLVLFGIPGAGKSTQGNLLSKQLNLPYLSTGHIFRNIAQEKTKWGRFIKETMASGHLIPDKETIEIVEDYLSRPEYQSGYILDGFPRNTYQANKFQNGIDFVLYLKIPDKESLWRIAGRNDSSRDDDTLSALKKRIEIFHKFTEPVLEYYRKKRLLVEINGLLSVKKVNEQILKSVGKTISKNGIRNWSKRRKVLLAVVGLPGAGKSAAAAYFKSKGFPVLRLGAITDDIIKERGLENNVANNKLVREEVREKHGMHAYMKLNTKKIKDLFAENNVVVIDGMRSYEEYEYALENFSSVYLLGIVADKKLRYARVRKRKDRSTLFGTKRDITEILNLNMGPTIALADKILINNGSVADLEDRLQEVYREVYFGSN